MSDEEKNSPPGATPVEDDLFQIDTVGEAYKPPRRAVRKTAFFSGLDSKIPESQLYMIRHDNDKFSKYSAENQGQSIFTDVVTPGERLAQAHQDKAERIKKTYMLPLETCPRKRKMVDILRYRGHFEKGRFFKRTNDPKPNRFVIGQVVDEGGMQPVNLDGSAARAVKSQPNVLEWAQTHLKLDL